MIRSDCSSTHRASPLDSLKDLDYCCREAKSSSVARIFGIRASNSLPPSQEPPSSTTRPLTSATAITAPIVNGVIMRNRKNSISTDGNTVTKETTTWVRGNTSRRTPLPSTGLRRCAARRRPRHAQMPGTDQIADNPCRQQYDHPCRSGKPCAIDHVKRNPERCRKRRHATALRTTAEMSLIVALVGALVHMPKCYARRSAAQFSPYARWASTAPWRRWPGRRSAHS